MRFVVRDEITGNAWPVEVPPGRNPVRIGRLAQGDVVLASNLVVPEAAVIGNPGDGWRLWNLADREVQVGSAVLYRRHQYAPLAPGATIRIPPYVLTVQFDTEEAASDSDHSDRLDRACATLVRDLHKQLNEQLSDAAGPEERLREAYVLALEKAIDDLAGLRPDFPVDDMTQTVLGNHLAGVAVRSELTRQLIAKSGVTTQTFKDAEETAAWARMRTELPGHERGLAALVEDVRSALTLDPGGDLTDQLRKLDADYWPTWDRRLRTTPVPAPALRRYLALRRLKEEIKDVWYGFGPLEDLLDDPTITEIMVVDAEHIFIEKGGQIEDSGRRFLTDPRTIIDRIVAKAGREINTSSPMADARMPDGSRVNAVIPPLALKGPCLTIRRFPRQRLSVEDLIRFGSLTPAARDFLQAAVVNRRNVIVSGGTGTGKTTLLNCLSEFIPDRERIVTIEDTAELRLHKQHVVTMQAKRKNAEDAGEVTIRDLVRNALRMRPDRIVVGECRGGEAIDMLQAMNTGHDGSMTTLHANSPADVVLRLEVMVQQNADTRLPVESIHRQIVSAVDVIVQLQVIHHNGRPRKVVSEIAEVVAGEDGGVRMKPVFAREGGGTLEATGFLPTFVTDLVTNGLLPDPLALVRAAGGGA